jgi:lipoate---protein ligase
MMKHCDLTLSSPEANLACDEALLEMGDDRAGEALLRLWEPASYFVVVGYANSVRTEVNLEFCAGRGIPVLRRCTGGGTVLQGPGVLNYSLILPVDAAGPCHSIPATNRYVLERHQSALAGWLQAPVELRGQTDLAIGGLKICGNAQRRKQRALLFHGSFLLGLDLSLVEQVLPLPSRQPAYRLNRSHADFLLNLNVPAAGLKQALVRAWNATEQAPEPPPTRIAELVREKYGRQDWNLKL